MRISDWSSDVCSSDLLDGQTAGKKRIEPGFANPLRQVVSAVRSRPIAGNQTLRNRDIHPNVRTENANAGDAKERSEEHTSELQSLMRISYADFCLKKKK